MRVLVLGGTADARALVAELATAGHAVVESLAGVTERPAPPGAERRVGGFGGVDGLARYLDHARIDAVVDATHPFAAQMSTNAVAACRAAGIPLCRLERPGWGGRPDASGWTWVSDLDAAVDAVRALGSRPFLATGSSTVPVWERWSGYALLRVVEPSHTVPDTWEVICARGPFRLADEIALLREHAIDVVVAKDAGGPTTAKLDAAAELGIPMVMVRRPKLPTADAVVDSPAAAVAWISALSSP